MDKKSVHFNLKTSECSEDQLHRSSHDINNNDNANLNGEVSGDQVGSDGYGIATYDSVPRSLIHQ